MVRKKSLNRILNVKILREFKENYKQFISVILIAVLAVSLFTGLLANYHHFEENVEQVYRDSNVAEWFVTTSTYDEDDINNLRHLKGVDDINQRLYMNATIEQGAVTIVACDTSPTISVPVITEGGAGVLIPKGMAERDNLKIGDEISIKASIDFKSMIGEANIASLQNLLLDGQTDFVQDNNIIVNLKITGIMTHAEAINKMGTSGSLIYTENAVLKHAIKTTFHQTYGSSNPIMQTVITKKINELVDSTPLFNQYVIKSENQELDAAINNYFLGKDENNLLISLSRSMMPATQTVEADIIQAKQLLFVFPTVFYIVGILVIATSLTQLINKERTNIGLMSALGISRKKIISHYATFAIFLTAIGGIIGVIFGPLIVPFAMGIKYSILYQIEEVAHPLIYIEYLLCFIILFLISVVISIIVSKNVVSKEPANILRNISNDKFKGSLLEKIPGLFNKLNLNIRMSIRNIRRHLSRSIMVIIGVMGCSSLLLCGFGINNTLDYGIDLEINNLIDYDIVVSYDLGTSDIDYSSVDNVDVYEDYLQTAIMVSFKQVTGNTYLIALENDSKIVNVNYNNEGVTLSSKLANDLGVNIGDTITIYYNSNEYHFEVSEIVELCFTQGVIISKDLLTSSGFTYSPNRSYLRVKDYQKLDQTTEEISNTFEGISSISNKEELLEQADNILTGISLITLIVKIFAILLAIVVIYNLAQLNYKERIRDIATLKVLGFGKNEVSQTLLFEIIILTIFGSLIGLTLGMPLLQLLLMVNETPLIAFIYHIDFISYVYTLLLTLGVSIVINLFLTKLTDKIQMVESLKSVE